MAGNKKANKKSPPQSGEKSGKNDKKPNLRGLHVKQSLRNVYTAIGLAALSGTLFYFLHNQKVKNAYQEFYANYDADESFIRMRDAGLLSSCPVETVVDAKKKNCLFSLGK